MSTVLAAPEGLDEGDLRAGLRDGWRITAASMTYRPVGWGSHHWDVTGTDGTRWFVTVDELSAKRQTGGEPLDAGFARLSASLAVATGLKEAGLGFVVAPVPAANGEPAVRLGGAFAAAVYPFVTGQSFSWGDFGPVSRRLALLGMVTSVHAAPAAVRGKGITDDFSVPLRDELEAAARGDAAGSGPYARPLAAVAREHATSIGRLLARYDDLAAAARSRRGRDVVTHGEPHPGNAMLTPGGWVLIDWDTALVAPPERDLWNLDPGDGSILGAYTEKTGVPLLPELLTLYRLRWDITDMAACAGRFRQPHTGDADDEKSWEVLNSLIIRYCG